MKTVIFAGGLGTRLMEETGDRPKPMVEIGGKPILWHLMKLYEHWGYNDFIVCLGYKGNQIKEYFLNYYINNSDISVELKNNRVQVHYSDTESFNVTLVDTGLNTKTAGRLKRIKKYLNDESFFLTYGDGLSDVNIPELVSFHKSHGRTVTMTAIQPEARFGGLAIEDNLIKVFKEKPKGDGQWINGGFFVVNSDVFDYLEGDMDDVMWEDEPLEELSKKQQLMAFKHHGFWKCMDALRDKLELEKLWNSQTPPWKLWS
jgi:glucose-1-phosphate cytidylyltransferase